MVAINARIPAIIGARALKTTGAKRTGLVFLTLLLSLSLCGCYRSPSNPSPNEAKQSENSASASNASEEGAYGEERLRDLEREQEAYEEEMRRLEESTPEAIADRLGIPQSQLWYNAGQYVGEVCTIAGPVASVHQATDANGMPIFVDIGAAYPSENRVTLVIWTEHYDDYAEMLYEVDHGGAWLSVSSYLDVYEGSLQMNSDNGCEYTWWTGVE